jgi:hypothetical protein
LEGNAIEIDEILHQFERATGKFAQASCVLIPVQEGDTEEWQKRTVSVRQRQEIQEVLRCMSRRRRLNQSPAAAIDALRTNVGLKGARDAQSAVTFLVILDNRHPRPANG